MSTPSNNVHDFPGEGVAAGTLSTPRPLYWSIRRELWENRSVYIAPLAVAGIVLFSYFIRTFRLARKVRSWSALDPAKQADAAFAPYSMAASVILFTGILVGLFYCLDALSSERRDRSILFWKSMPVSDLTTVLSKASIPIAVQPLIAFTIALATQLIMLQMGTLALLASGMNPSTALLARLPLVESTLVMAYGVFVHALWYAPLYAWILLLSAWARRAVILWVVLPFFVVFAIERLGSATSLVADLLKYRFLGAMQLAFSTDALKTHVTRLEQLTPLRFFSSPGLWLGLLFAAACLALAVQLRRNREPN